MNLTHRLFAATAALIAFTAPAVAHSNETLWLRCTETSSTGRIGSYRYDILAISEVENSIVSYTIDEGQEALPRRWGDFCTEQNAVCTINSDQISVRFSFGQSARYTLTIDRRSGVGAWRASGSSGVQFGSQTSQCRRIDDPRPPAAF